MYWYEKNREYYVAIKINPFKLFNARVAKCTAMLRSYKMLGSFYFYCIV